MSVMDEPDVSASFIEQRNARIRTLYDSGMLLKHIAAEVGIAPNYVGVILKKMGVERPSKPQKARKYVDATAVRKAWDDGLSVSAIAERYSVSDHLVRNALKAQGIDLASMPRRRRFDGEAGHGGRSGNAFARMARRT